jgi:hypothetical protein
MTQTTTLPAVAGHVFSFTVAASSKEKTKHSFGASPPAEREDAHAWQMQWSCPRPDDIVLSASANSRSLTACIEQRVSPYAQASLSCTASLSGRPSSLVMSVNRSLPHDCACSIGLTLPSNLLPEARWLLVARALNGEQEDRDKSKEKDKYRDAEEASPADHRLILTAKAHLSSVTLGASAAAKFKATPTDHFSLGIAADVTQEHLVSGYVALKTNFGKRTQAGLKVSVNPGGVIITPWISRLKQKLHLPLSLAFAPTVASSLLFTTLPLLLSALILRFVELPRRARIDAQVRQTKPFSRSLLLAPTPDLFSSRQRPARVMKAPPPPRPSGKRRSRAFAALALLYFLFLMLKQIRGAYSAPGGAEDRARRCSERPCHCQSAVRLRTAPPPHLPSLSPSK